MDFIKMKWETKHLQFVRMYSSKYTDYVLAKIMSNLFNVRASEGAVRKQRQLMGLRKLPGRGICKMEHKKNEQ